MLSGRPARPMPRRETGKGVASDTKSYFECRSSYADRRLTGRKEDQRTESVGAGMESELFLEHEHAKADEAKDECRC